MRRSDVELWRWPALLEREPPPSIHLRRGSQQDVLEGLRRLQSSATHERPRRWPTLFCAVVTVSRGWRRGWWRQLWGRA